MSEESNVWYAKYYEAFFDKVYVVSLLGKSKREGQSGETLFVSVGSGNNKKDLMLAPLRLYQFAKKVNATVLLTYEQVWLWWLKSLMSLLRPTKIYLMPITIPGSIYKATGKSLSRNIPIAIEMKMINRSYHATDYALTSSAYGNYTEWLSHEKILGPKLLVAEKLPEALPTPYFFASIDKSKKSSANTFKQLLYVGRLHKEKLVDDLIRVLAILNRDSKKYELTLIGDGDEKEKLERLAKELKVSDSVRFLGYVANGQLPDYYVNADVFVSPLIGSSLREAALCALPIVAYNMDWLTTVLTHEKDFLGVKPHDFESFAAAVARISDDQQLAKRLSDNVRSLAWRMWSPDQLGASLEYVFSDTNLN